jgi:hypothetical protein
MGVFGRTFEWAALAPLGFLCGWLVLLGGVEFGITGTVETTGTVAAFVGVVATFAAPTSMMLVCCCTVASLHSAGIILLYPCLAWALASQPGLRSE